jgi:very-short-patch-repair endonuclease
MTDAEKALWAKLRGHQLHGMGFRRQESIGPYVVDFVCREAKLIVEVDGGQHAESESDAVRDAFLARGGFRVLRFWNNEVLSNLDGVLARIAEALATEST